MRQGNVGSVLIKGGLVVGVVASQVGEVAVRLYLAVGRLADSEVATRVAGFKLVIKVLCRVVEAPACIAAQRGGAAASEDGGEGAASEAEAFAVVARRVFHILDFKHRFLSVFAGKGEIIHIIGTKRILIFLLFHKLLAPNICVIVVMHIEVSLEQHCLSGSFCGATEVFGGIFALVTQHTLGSGEVFDDVSVDVVDRCSRLMPIVRRINIFVYIGHSTEYSHQSEVVVTAHKMSFAYQTSF